MSKKTDPVDSGALAIENEGGAQAAESVNSGSPAIVFASSREELEKKINDLKAKQPEGVSLIAGPIAQNAFGQYLTRINYIKK